MANTNKYKESTIPVSFRVPLSKVPEFKAANYKKLAKWARKKPRNPNRS